ncbi:MAG: hypothetical protein ACM3P1_10960 [Candidatus Saccharibacteria bacterium]
MKKNRLIFVFATLLIGVALVFSCQKEEATSDGQGLKLKSASIDCGTCVPDWTASLVTYGGWVKYNKPAEGANIKLDVYNDGANVYYKVYRPSGTFGEVWVDGVQVYMGVGVSTYSWQKTLAEGWDACDPVTCSIELRGVSGGTGRTNNKSITYYLREKCMDSCEESFTYTNNGNNSYTFTYTPDEDMIDQTVVFTFPQAKTVLGLDESWETKGATRQKTMSFTECEPVSWTLTFTPDCAGHSGQSNVWTDFTIGGVPKKGSLTNIVIECSNNN